MIDVAANHAVGRQPTRSGPTRVAAGSFAAFALLLGTFLLAQGAATAGIASIALGALAVLLVLPADLLPALAVLSFAAAPYWLFGGTPLIGSTGLGPVIMLVWAARMLAGPRAQRAWRGRGVLIPLLAILVTISVVASLLLTERQGNSTFTYGPIPWAVSFCIAVLLPAITIRTERMLRWLQQMWLVVGAAFGVASLVEQFMRFPIIYGHLYAGRSLNIEQRWSVYRSFVSFGHPLYAGLFFSLAAAIGISLWLKSGKRSPLMLGVVAFVGAVSTVSRGSLFALAAAIAFAALATTLSRRRSVNRDVRLLLLAVGGFAAAALTLNSTLVNDRASSEEASTSSGARSDLSSIALELSQGSSIFGTGPGTSSAVASEYTRLVIENSWLQLLVSLGFVGLTLVVWLVAAAFAAAWGRRDPVGIAVLSCFVVGVGVFNGLDDVPSLHTVLSVTLLLAFGPSAIRPRRKTKYGGTGRPLSSGR